MNWKDSSSSFHDPSRSGTWTWTSFTKSALTQVTRKHLAGQSYPVLWRERKHQSVGDSSLNASPTHPPTSSGHSHFLCHLLGFCFSSLIPHRVPFFSRPLSFPSVSMSLPPYRTPSSLIYSHVPSSTLRSPAGVWVCLGMGLWGPKGGCHHCREAELVLRRFKSSASLGPLHPQPTQASCFSPAVWWRKEPASGCEGKWKNTSEVAILRKSHQRPVLGCRNALESASGIPF